MRLRDRPYTGLLPLCLAFGLCALVRPARAQNVPSTTPGAGNGSATSPTPVAIERTELLKPGVELMRKGEAAAALKAFRPALEAYPNDSMVLSLGAQAAMEAHQNETALNLFQRSLQQKPALPWHTWVAVILLEARLGRWADFDLDQAALKKAKLAGEQELAASPAFLVDDFEVAGTSVKVAYFPAPVGEYKTLYRFMLPVPPHEENPDFAGEVKPDVCKNPSFAPYLDVESDDADQAMFQAQHPELAAQGERKYSLDTYPAACSQGLVKFYSEGEPKYEKLRADVIKYLQAKPTLQPLQTNDH